MVRFPEPVSAAAARIRDLGSRREYIGDGCGVVAELHGDLYLLEWHGRATVPFFEVYDAAWQEMVTKWRAEGKRRIQLTLTARSERPGADVRKRISEHTKEFGTTATDVVVANGIVVENALMRGALTAVSWLDPVISFKVVKSLAEGITWAREVAHEHDLDVPRHVAYPDGLPGI